MRRYGEGVLGMALSGRDTGGSQFFFTHAPEPHLDGRYTAFGEVVSGLDVVVDARRGRRDPGAHGRVMRALLVVASALVLACGCVPTVRAGDFYATPLMRVAARALGGRSALARAAGAVECATMGAPIVFVPALGLTQHSWAGVDGGAGGMSPARARRSAGRRRVAADAGAFDGEAVAAGARRASSTRWRRTAASCSPATRSAARSRRGWRHGSAARASRRWCSSPRRWRRSRSIAGSGCCCCRRCGRRCCTSPARGRACGSGCGARLRRRRSRLAARRRAHRR